MIESHYTQKAKAKCTRMFSFDFYAKQKQCNPKKYIIITLTKHRTIIIVITSRIGHEK